MKGFSVLFFVMVSVLAFVFPAFADVPYLINYQGIVTETDGTPITGTHDVTFKIYPDSLPATSPLWTELHTGIEIDEGLFNVILGGTTPIPVAGTGARLR